MLAVPLLRIARKADYQYQEPNKAAGDIAKAKSFNFPAAS
jgi:hypothetical protein